MVLYFKTPQTAICLILLLQQDVGLVYDYKIRIEIISGMQE